jgi:hypothetical protein
MQVLHVNNATLFLDNMFMCLDNSLVALPGKLNC